MLVEYMFLYSETNVVGVNSKETLRPSKQYVLRNFMINWWPIDYHHVLGLESNYPKI